MRGFKTLTEYKNKISELKNEMKNFDINSIEYQNISNQINSYKKSNKEFMSELINFADEKGMNLQNISENQEVIKKYENDYEEYKNYIAQREKALENANKRAYEDKTTITNVYEKGVIVEGGTVIDSIGIKGGEQLNKVFLNKTDKLVDTVKLSDETNALNDDGALAEVVKGMVTGKWSNMAIKNAVTTTTSGVLIPEVLSAKIIDLAREKSLFSSVGVPTVNMNTDNVKISRVKKDPTFKFKAEGQEADESSFELDSVDLKSKTAYGYAYVTLEAIKSSINLDSILYKVFSEAMANCIDRAFLYGQNEDTFAPSGILNDSEINHIIADTETVYIYDDIIRAIGKIKGFNGVPTALGINSNTEELLAISKTSDGQYLKAPLSVEKLNKVVSNQLKHNEETGSDALVFDPQALLIGIQNNIQIKMIEDGECLKKGLIAFQIYSMLDCKAVVPKNICKITGIK